jgi:hypothetical protein
MQRQIGGRYINDLQIFRRLQIYFSGLAHICLFVTCLFISPALTSGDTSDCVR